MFLPFEAHRESIFTGSWVNRGIEMDVEKCKVEQTAYITVVPIDALQLSQRA